MVKKPKKAVRILLCVLFIFLASAATLILSSVSKPRWSEGFKSGVNVRAFYDMPRNSVDVLILGSSNVICGVNANTMYSDFGISAYCLGTESQPALGSYTFLQEAEKRQDLSAVVFDVGGLFDEIDEPNYRKVFDYMPLSALKLKMLQEYKTVNPDMDMASYLLPLITYHGRFVQPEDKESYPDSPALRGFYIRTEVRGTELKGISEIEGVEPSQIPPENYSFFIQLCDYCRSNEIPLLLICGPDVKFHADDHNAVAAVTQEYSLPFLDFNQKELFPDIEYANDMADFQHFNVYGADKATAYICNELNKLCTVPDRSGDPLQIMLADEYSSARNRA